MSDDFGTVNVRSGDRGREIELKRQQYRQHRDALVRMTAEAPTEQLAREYQRLVRDIEASLRKLDELEGQPLEGQPSSLDETVTDGSRATDPAMRPVPPPRSAGDVLLAPGAAASPLTVPPVSHDSGSRVVLIILAGVIALGLIGWVIYRASSERRHPAAVAEAPAANATTGTNPAPTVTSIAETASSPTAPGGKQVSEPTASAIIVTPGSADFGTIRKGARAVRPFVVKNTTNAPIEIAVTRSACKCLFYEYRPKVPAKGKETLTVAVDGARAPIGSLSETLKVSLKKDPSVTATFRVTATIK
jgi:hypothetical protein